MKFQADIQPMTVTPLPLTNLRLITTADYHRMAEVGILAADEQVELIAGQIIRKMPKSSAHSALCKRIEKCLEKLLGDQVLVRLQDPIQLATYSEPEPDNGYRYIYGFLHSATDHTSSILHKTVVSQKLINFWIGKPFEPFILNQSI